MVVERGTGGGCGHTVSAILADGNGSYVPQLGLIMGHATLAAEELVVTPLIPPRMTVKGSSSRR
jgi:hypothetical protein